MKSFAASEAPPINPPSTSGIANSSGALFGLTLPPYRIVTFAASALALAPCRDEFGRDCAVAFPIETAPLRVADDRETAAKLLEHRSRHLSRVGSGVVLGNVLRAPGNPAARQSLRDLCEVGKRCAHRVTETLGLLEARLERVQQPCVRCEAAVHLPVACYQPRAHPVRESRKGGDSTAGSP